MKSLRKMLKVIINADDFGINEIVTKEIERLIESGIITSTTIMANGRCLDEVSKFASVHPEVSFGIHYCLSEFESLTKSPVFFKEGLINEDGIFVKRAIFKVDRITRELEDAIKKELSVQTEKILEKKIPISHADSHHHIHTVKGFETIFKEVLSSYNISKIRRGVDFDSLKFRLHVCKWYQRAYINKYYKRNFVTTEKFLSYKSAISRLESDFNTFEGIKSIELMCHPGHPSEKYQNEIIQLEEQFLNNYISYTRISYNEL